MIGCCFLRLLVLLEDRIFLVFFDLPKYVGVPWEIGLGDFVLLSCFRLICWSEAGRLLVMFLFPLVFLRGGHVGVQYRTSAIKKLLLYCFTIKKLKRLKIRFKHFTSPGK